MKRAVFLSLALLAAGTAHAALVSLDSDFGPDTITQDTATGLEWLDWDLTIGLSFDDVTAELGAGGIYEGFRFATADEVETLWLNAGIVDITEVGPVDIPTDFTTANFAAGSELLDLFGDTGTPFPLTEAITSTPSVVPGELVVAEIQLCESGLCVNRFGAPPLSALASLGPNTTAPDAGISFAGAALVRDTAVIPVPGALWLALSGLLVIGRAARARR